MLDHISIGVKDLLAAKKFYTEVFATIGVKLIVEFEQYAGFGTERPMFWLGVGGETQQPGFHVGFSAQNKEEVHSFYDKAIELGATDNGSPGPRPEYGPEYYGAFVNDLDGHRIEVCYRTKD